MQDTTESRARHGLERRKGEEGRRKKESYWLVQSTILHTTQHTVLTHILEYTQYRICGTAIHILFALLPDAVHRTPDLDCTIVQCKRMSHYIIVSKGPNAHLGGTIERPTPFPASGAALLLQRFRGLGGRRGEGRQERGRGGGGEPPVGSFYRWSVKPFHNTCVAEKGGSERG
jgi:hypothetical protein